MLHSLFTLLILAFAPPHGLHLSVTNIDYSYDLEKISVQIKLTKHDLEHALTSEANQYVTLNDTTFEHDLSSWIDRYIESRLIFSSKNTQFKLVPSKDKIIDDDAVLVFYEIKEVKPPVILRIQNTILLEKFETQKNMVFVKLKDKTKHLIFNKDNFAEEITIE